MKIGFDAKRIFKNHTGLGNYSRAMIRLLTTYYPENEYFLYSPSIGGIYEHFYDDKKNIAVKNAEGLWKKFGSLWRSFHIASLAQSDCLDVFHGLSHELPYGLPHGVKSVVTMHDLIVWRNPEFFHKVDVPIYRKKQKDACKRAEVIVAVSEQTKKDLVDIMNVEPERIKVVYQPCHEMFYNPVSQEDVKSVKEKYGLPEHYILCVGRMEQRKNLISVVRALPMLPEEISIVAIGKPSEYSKVIENEADRLNVRRRLKMTVADFPDFPALYKGAEVFVYPSFFEGFGIPILEAMNCGTPVVTSNVSSMPEVGGEAVAYVNPNDFEDIASKINKIIEDSEYRHSLVEKEKSQVIKFSDKNIADALWEIYL